MSDEKKNDSNQEKEEEAQGVSGGILESMGKIIPGLGGLLKNLEKSPAFRERLKKVDGEVERKIKETPLKRTEGRASSIPGGIPPGVRGSAVSRKSFVKQPSEKGMTSPPPAPQERPVDVFDEPDHIKVVAEIPGVEENEIKIDLVDDNLEISANTPDRKYHQKLRLPSAPKGKPEKTYRNGILEV
ncbi:MAG: Hsp20/alpha crystallin family protein, partial [Kiritimatiellae bacterium]|nr:Hsp20/alpha crystallin family protein [Kiritimatiellia bacterium]